MAGVRAVRLNVGGGFPSHRVVGVEPDLTSIFQEISEYPRGIVLVTGALDFTVRVGEEWAIDGSKAWCTNASIADYIITLVRTDPAGGPHSLSMIIVPTDTPGFNQIRTIPVMGEAGTDYTGHGEILYHHAAGKTGLRGEPFGRADRMRAPGGGDRSHAGGLRLLAAPGDD